MEKINLVEGKQLSTALGISEERFKEIKKKMTDVAMKYIVGGGKSSDAINDCVEYAQTQAEAYFMCYMLGDVARKYDNILSHGSDGLTSMLLSVMGGIAGRPKVKKFKKGSKVNASADGDAVKSDKKE